jgi:hypothetical protein
MLSPGLNKGVTAFAMPVPALICSKTRTYDIRVCALGDFRNRVKNQGYENVTTLE